MQPTFLPLPSVSRVLSRNRQSFFHFSQLTTENNAYFSPIGRRGIKIPLATLGKLPGGGKEGARGVLTCRLLLWYSESNPPVIKRKAQKGLS